MERQGIATVAIQLLRTVAEKVRPPRALVVPFAHGQPLGEPNNAPLQTAVIEKALDLLEETEAAPPMIAEFTPIS